MKISKLSGISEVTLADPKTLKIKFTDGSVNMYLMHKEALRYLYWKLGLSSTVSEKVYYISQEIWSEIMNLKLSQNTDFDFILLHYIVIDDDSIMSIQENDPTEVLDKFNKEYGSLEVHELENNSNIYQIQVSSDIDENNKALVLLDIDYKNGLYRAYDGIRTVDRILIPGSPTIEEGDFGKFLSSINLTDELNMSIKLSKSLIREYDRNSASEMVLSLREVLDIIKMSKLNVELSNSGMVSRITGIEDTDELIEFLNSFDMPYKSLRKLTYLKKSLKYKDLTVDGMLGIFTREYDSQDNSISAYLISYLMRIYYSQDSDRNTVKEELNK